MALETFAFGGWVLATGRAALFLEVGAWPAAGLTGSGTGTSTFGGKILDFFFRGNGFVFATSLGTSSFPCEPLPHARLPPFDSRPTHFRIQNSWCVFLNSVISSSVFLPSKRAPI